MYEKTMEFARRQLEKYGWSDGNKKKIFQPATSSDEKSKFCKDFNSAGVEESHFLTSFSKGLGKREDGIAQALKPKLKRSVTGIGHDAAADFTEHWWTTLYNKAASNIEVEERKGKTEKIKTKDSKNFEITNDTWKLKRKPKTKEVEEQYENFFIKKAVLTNGGSKTKRVESETDSEEEVTKKKDVLKMTDEELFAACEGRTAHKGARHGLKASGKLARIEQQEQLLLQQTKYEGYSHKKKIKEIENDDQVIENTSLNNEIEALSIKRKKKKRKRCISNENVESNTKAELEIPLLKEKKKKRSYRDTTTEKIDECEECASDSQDRQENKSKRKKKKVLTTKS